MKIIIMVTIIITRPHDYDGLFGLLLFIYYKNNTKKNTNSNSNNKRIYSLSTGHTKGPTSKEYRT